MKKIILTILAAAFCAMPLRAQPTITQQPTGRALWVGGNVTFAVGVSNAGPSTFQWQLNGTNLPNGIITTVAGGAVNDNIPATNAILNQPEDVAVDTQGNLFVADTGDGRVCRISRNGILTKIAGCDWRNIYGGDDIHATNAFLVSPKGVAVDAFGNLFIVDSGSAVVRRVDTNGIITTVAGNGTNAYSGDGGAATNASLSYPEGLSVDSSGNLFIADWGNGRIREVDIHGDITTVAGGGTNYYIVENEMATNMNLGSPFDVAVDGDGNLFVVTFGTFAISGIYVVDANGRFVIDIPWWGPTEVAVDAAGNLFYSDYYGYICERNPNLISIYMLAGNGTNGYSGDGGVATNASLNQPMGLTVDSIGNVFFADSLNHVIRKIATNGIITTVAGCGTSAGDGRLATNALLKYPGSVVIDRSGNLFIADNRAGSCIREVDTNGLISTIAGRNLLGFQDGVKATNSAVWASDLAFDSGGNLFLDESYFIRRIDTNGIIRTVVGNITNFSYGYSGDGGFATNATICSSSGLDFDATGNLYIADTGNNVVRKVDTNGIIWTIAGNGTEGYSGDGGAATNASFSSPGGVLLDGLGNLLIADSGNCAIRCVNSNGTISTIAGGLTNTNLGDGGLAINAGLSWPSSMALNASGELFIADVDDCLIRKVDRSGIITTVAGNGTNEFSGDGGAASNASLNFPYHVTLDPAGNLFIADAENDRIRKVTNTQGPILTLNNVTRANAGDYRVVATGAGGSVTSSVVNLIVASAPLVYQTTRLSNGGVSLNFLCQPGSTNEVQCANSLSPPIHWQILSTNVAGPDGNWQFTDGNAASHQARFYRSHTR